MSPTVGILVGGTGRTGHLRQATSGRANEAELSSDAYNPDISSSY